MKLRQILLELRGLEVFILLASLFIRFLLSCLEVNPFEGLTLLFVETVLHFIERSVTPSVFKLKREFSLSRQVLKHFVMSFASSQMTHMS